MSNVLWCSIELLYHMVYNMAQFLYEAMYLNSRQQEAGRDNGYLAQCTSPHS